MFGYITPLQPEMKIKDFNQFRAYYCGVCKSIKKNYGNLPRMCLNYDMAFLALFLDSLNPDKVLVTKERCMVHPINKRLIASDNDAIGYAASMNVSLVYLKLLDDVHDDKDIKSKLLSLALKPYKNKFSDNINLINTIIEDNLKRLSNMEDNKTFNSIDEISDPFSNIVGKIIRFYPYKIVDDTKENREKLYRFGYCLGKWIYLIDALDDLEDDMKKNKFNPISYLYNKDGLNYDEFLPTIKERIEFSILNVACTCKEILDELNLTRNKDILENIISLGMMDKLTKVTTNCKCKDKKNKSYYI